MEKMQNMSPEERESPEVDSFRKREDTINNWLYAKNTGRQMAEALHLQEYAELEDRLIQPKAKKIQTPELDPAETEYLKKLENYSRIKIATSRLQADLLYKMRNDPGFWENPLYALTQDDLFMEISQTIEPESLFRIVEKCAEMHMAVENAYTQYPTPSALYEHAFGRAPQGKVEVIKGPVSLYFQCFDLYDYAWIHKQSFFDQSASLTEDDVQMASKSGGCAISLAAPEDLRGLIIAENSNYISDSESTRKHEEEHVIRRIIKDEWYPERYPMIPSYYKNEVSQKIRDLRDALPNNGRDTGYIDDIPQSLAEQHLDLIFQQRSYEVYARGADEILAYFKDGMHSAPETYYILTTPKQEGGLYDYFDDECESILSISDKKEGKLLVRRACDRAKHKYHALLKSAFEALRDLYGSGKFSRDEVIAIFDKEPLVKWPKVTKRLLISDSK